MQPYQRVRPFIATPRARQEADGQLILVIPSKDGRIKLDVPLKTQMALSEYVLDELAGLLRAIQPELVTRHSEIRFRDFVNKSPALAVEYLCI